MYTLKDWSIIYWYEDPYMDPWINPKCLLGFREEDQKRVKTSPIKKADGRSVQTQSGSIYQLAEPSPDYLRYLREQGIEFNPDDPIKDQHFGDKNE